MHTTRSRRTRRSAATSSMAASPAHRISKISASPRYCSPTIAPRTGRTAAHSSTPTSSSTTSRATKPAAPKSVSDPASRVASSAAVFSPPTATSRSYCAGICSIRPTPAPRRQPSAASASNWSWPTTITSRSVPICNPTSSCARSISRCFAPTAMSGTRPTSGCWPSTTACPPPTRSPASPSS